MADRRCFGGVRGVVLFGCLMAAAGCANLRVAAVPAPLEAETAPVTMPSVPAPDAAANWVPPGYRVEMVVQDLIYPSSAEFDDAGNLYIAEAGYVYGDHNAPTRIWRVAPSGELAVVADRGLQGPITDLLWHGGRMYVSHQTKISVFEPDGRVRDLVAGLPSLGDHHNNQMTAGPDGRIYFGQGTATNSGVVGIDNVLYLWLPQYPGVHDQPAQTIQLRNETFTTANAFILAGGEGPLLVRTAAFQAFGTGMQSRTVPGVTKAGGTILSMAPDGSDLRVYAWGLRNPFGVLWGPDGKLYASENGFDERGSRPIANDPDDLYVIKEGGWYGWPDYAAGIPVTDERFRPKDGPKLEFLMAEHPQVEQPWMTFAPHAAVAKLGANHTDTFGDPGSLFMAIWGHAMPLTGHGTPPALGQQVVRIDPRTQQVETFFASRREATAGEADELARELTAGMRRPMDVVFSPDGGAMYVVDLGVLAVLETRVPMLKPFPGTGVVWRIVPEGEAVSGPPAGLSVLQPGPQSRR